eukprot:299323-Chlamydomonas_euryale.AAC.1
MCGSRPETHAFPRRPHIAPAPHRRHLPRASPPQAVPHLQVGQAPKHAVWQMLDAVAVEPKLPQRRQLAEFDRYGRQAVGVQPAACGVAVGVVSGVVNGGCSGHARQEEDGKVWSPGRDEQSFWVLLVER